MGIEAIDYQSIIHQQISLLMDSWRQAGLSESEIQEAASQFFNMGLIASQQVQQEGGVQPEGQTEKILYTEDSATRVITQFLEGLGTGLIKAHEQRLPSQERWQLMQEVAFHVFEQSKQLIVATMGQDLTPDIQLPKDQLLGLLNHTATEALLYYLNEYEKKNGPIARMEEAFLQDAIASMSLPGMSLEPGAEELINAPVAPMAPPIAQPSEVHYKFAAIGLLLGSLPIPKQQSILSAFRPEEQQIINQYRNPDVVAASLDLNRVAEYLKHFKSKLGRSSSQKPVAGKDYSSPLIKAIQKIPPQRLERLFQQERPLVRGYIRQCISKDGQGEHQLPPGVEESLLLYLERNFPEVAGTL